LLEAAGLAIETDDLRALAWCVRELGHLASAEERHAEAVRLLSAAEDLRLALGTSFNPADPDELRESTARARASIGDPTFASLWGAPSGRVLSEAHARAVNALREAGGA
jgi:hypothetical protein